jgi:hypothetical protein
LIGNSQAIRAQCKLTRQKIRKISAENANGEGADHSRLEVISMREKDSLNPFEVQSPCDANWDEMRGGDRTRFCRRCRLDVTDVSTLKRKEALKLVQGAGGRICIRYGKNPQTNAPALEFYRNLGARTGARDENRLAKIDFRNLTNVGEVFGFGEFADQLDDSGAVMRLGFFDVKSHYEFHAT